MGSVLAGREAGKRRRNFDFVMRRDDWTCQYCQFPAEDVDHIIPYSWRKDNSLENLVASCKRCNLLAGNQLFTSFADKRDYLLKLRRPEIEAWARLAGLHNLMRRMDVDATDWAAEEENELSDNATLAPTIDPEASSYKTPGQR